MQRLRTTFKRSRTPTGAEMKSQSSLEVPKQIRSASFDEIQLQSKRQDDSRPASSSGSVYSPSRQDSTRGRRSSTLKVPQLQTGQRSKSFDAYSASSGSSSGSQLLPVGFERPETPIIQVSGCYHCACVEESKRLAEDPSKDDTELGRSRAEIDNSTDISENESDHEDEPKREGSPEILVTFTSDDAAQCLPSTVDVAPEASPEVRMEFPERQRRLSRQEALTCFPLELPGAFSAKSEEQTRARMMTVASSSAETEDDDDDEENYVACKSTKFIVRDIFLTVPELKRDRAASVDSCFNNNKNGSGVTDSDLLAVPQQSIRSKSVDIVLPTDVRTRYTALLPGTERRPSIGWVRLIDGAATSGLRSCAFFISRDTSIKFRSTVVSLSDCSPASSMRLSIPAGLFCNFFNVRVI